MTLNFKLYNANFDFDCNCNCNMYNCTYMYTVALGDDTCTPGSYTKYYMYMYRTTVPYYTTAVLVPTTKSVASLCGLRLVVWPKFGTNPARVAFGPLWLFNQNYGKLLNLNLIT